MSRSLAEKESEIVERYSLIEDRHERLAAITSQKRPYLILVENLRIDELLIPGCVSRVWLKIEAREQTLSLRFAAESALLNGLVGLIVELFDGADWEDAAVYSPSLLEKLGLPQMLSATRLNGLASVFASIQQSARRFRGNVDRRA